MLFSLCVSDARPFLDVTHLSEKGIVSEIPFSKNLMRKHPLIFF